MLRPLLAFALIYCTTATALAQSDVPISSLIPTPNKTIHDWPTSAADLPISHRIQIVTFASPGKRHTCTVHDVTPDTILCGSSKKPTTYERKDIAALIVPPSHTEGNILLIPIAMMAVSLVGSFFVPLDWSITLRVFAGLCFAAFGAMGVGDQGSDHNHDTLLYQRADTTLTIHLR